MINQHTEMRDQLQERHEDMVNDINPYTNCRVELHGLDMTRDTSGPSSKELLGQADMTLGRVGDKSCMCIIYNEGCSSSSGRRLAKDVIKVNGLMPNRQGEKLFETMISLKNTVLGMKEERIQGEDEIRDTLNNMMSAMSKIMEKLDMDPVFDPKKKAKSPKKPKQAKPSEDQEDETAKGDLFKRNLLAVEDNMKSQGKLVESKIEAMENKVESIATKEDIKDVKSEVDMIKGKVESMEKTMEEMKEMLSQLMMRGGVEA